MIKICPVCKNVLRSITDSETTPLRWCNQFGHNFEIDRSGTCLYIGGYTVYKINLQGRITIFYDGDNVFRGAGFDLENTSLLSTEEIQNFLLLI